MALSEGLKEQIIKVAGTRELIPGILTYDLRTGKWFMPVEELKKEKPKGHRAKRNKRRKMARASRKRNRR